MADAIEVVEIIAELQVECPTCKEPCGCWCKGTGNVLVASDVYTIDAALLSQNPPKGWVHSTRRLAAMEHVERNYRNERVRKLAADPKVLPFDELKQACANVGIDLDCGRCAAQFYTGHVVTQPHTCKADRARPQTAREEQLIGFIGQRNRSITLARDEADDQRYLVFRWRRLFRETQDALVRYGRHQDTCTRIDERSCTCGLAQAIYKEQPSDRPLIAERIAQWIEGYEDEPVDAKLAAQAIRDGKWR